jgi:hypothetical protein
MSNPILKNLATLCLNRNRLRKNIFFILFTFFISISILHAQCITTGNTNASNFTTDNTIGVYNFSSPGNAQTSDNSRAIASSLIAILSGNTYYLKATGFNFNIPSYASICGITVQIEHRATGLILTAAVKDNQVKIIKNGVITGTNKAINTNWGTSDVYATYGGSSDMWGTTLMPNDVNASDFGIAFSANITALIAALPTAEIDHIEMSIDYNPVLPVSFVYFKSEKESNKINLEWETSEEENDAYVELQRSFNGAAWQSIVQFEMHSINSNKIYNFTDFVNEKGVYAYRLKTILASRQTSYSEIKKITFSGSNIISLNPFPANDFITIYNSENFEDISIINLYAQHFKPPFKKINNNSLRVNIQNLPKGIYFAIVGNRAIKFLKE